MPQVKTFRAPTAYEEEMLKAQRQRQLAELLQQQAMAPEQEPYTFQGFRAMPSPLNALSRVLQAYGSKKAMERAEEAEGKAREADIAGAERLRQELAPQARVAAPTSQEIAASVGMPQIGAEGEVTYGAAQQAPLRTEMVGPTAAERRNIFANYAVTGTPTAQRLAQVMAGQEPQTQTMEFGGRLLNVTDGQATPVTMGGVEIAEPKKPRTRISSDDLGNKVRINYSDGTYEEIPKGIAPTAGAGKGSETAEGLRKEFTNQTSQYRGVADAFQKIKSAALNPSAANDLSLIFGYMRALDPASTVREGEFANAQNAGGIDATIRNVYNKVASGERLTQAQRQDFLQSAYGLVESQIPNVQQTIDRYTSIASRAGLNPEDIVSDPFASVRIPRLQGDNDPMFAKLKSGDLFIAPNGRIMRKR
jgi:hypothetical protein